MFNPRCTCWLLLAVLLTTTPALAAHIIAQVSDSLHDCDWPAVAYSPDGLTSVAWEEEDPMYGSSVWVQVLLPSDEILPPVCLGSGQRPALCWSREGFVLAMVSDMFVVIFESDPEGVWDQMPVTYLDIGFDAVSPNRVDLWGSADYSADPFVFLTYGVRTWFPDDRKVVFADRGLLGWSAPEVLLDGLADVPYPQVTFSEGPYGPLPRVYYLADAGGGVPGLFHILREPGSVWTAPEPVPGPVGGEFDVTAWSGGHRGVLGCGLQPTCPCNNIYYLGFAPSRSWCPPEDLTVDYFTDYDWPMSPAIAADPDGRVHAFWFQEGAGPLLDPRLRTLEYRVREDGVWTDEGDFLNEQDGPPLGSRVAMCVTDEGEGVMAWTRQDTILGYPMPRAVWCARPDVIAPVPGEAPPVRRPTLSAEPNPFNPRTTISFYLPGSGPASLAVHDLRGRRVASLWDGILDGREFTLSWDGRDDTGRVLPAGAYLLRLQGAGGVLARKVILAK